MVVGRGFGRYQFAGSGGIVCIFEKNLLYVTDVCLGFLYGVEGVCGVP